MTTTTSMCDEVLTADRRSVSISDRARNAILISFCYLCPLTDLKIGDIQSVEIFGLLLSFGMIALTLLNRGIVTVRPAIAKLIRQYSIFLLLTAVLAIASLRLPMFPPGEIGFLKQAPLLSMSRIVQLLVCIGSFLCATHLLIVNRSKIPLFAQQYVWAGLISAGYASASYVGWLAGFELPGAYQVSNLRAKGFFVEGGPFGVYLVSVLVVQMIRRQKSMVDPAIYLIQNAVLIAALMLSNSKAAILLIALLFAFFQISRKKYFLLFIVAGISIPYFFYLGSQGGLQIYINSYIDFDEQIQLHLEDGNFANGRIMASILVPRMVAEYPLLGIGIGNYSLQRNNPDILDGLPTTSEWDLPGLGLLGYFAELGIPLTLYLAWVIWRPVHISKLRGSIPVVVMAAGFQLFAHLFGAPITFAYPWLISALAVAVALQEPRAPLAVNCHRPPEKLAELSVRQAGPV